MQVGGGGCAEGTGAPHGSEVLLLVPVVLLLGKKKKKAHCSEQKAQVQVTVSSSAQWSLRTCSVPGRVWAMGDTGSGAGQQIGARQGALTGGPGSPQTGPAHAGPCER